MTAITCAYRWEAVREGNFRDGYLELSIEVWHKKHGLWIE